MPHIRRLHLKVRWLTFYTLYLDSSCVDLLLFPLPVLIASRLHSLFAQTFPISSEVISMHKHHLVFPVDDFNQVFSQLVGDAVWAARPKEQPLRQHAWRWVRTNMASSFIIAHSWFWLKSSACFQGTCSKGIRAWTNLIYDVGDLL